jgi:hypothetical protein
MPSSLNGMPFQYFKMCPLYTELMHLFLVCFVTVRLTYIFIDYPDCEYIIIFRCVCIILVFVNKQAFWRWRFPNMGIEGVELRKTDKRQKSYITIDVFKIMIYSQSG